MNTKKHFSYNSTLCYMVSLVKRFFYFFSIKKPALKAAAEHEEKKKIISQDNAEGELRQPIKVQFDINNGLPFEPRAEYKEKIQKYIQKHTECNIHKPEWTKNPHKPFSYSQ